LYTTQSRKRRRAARTTVTNLAVDIRTQCTDPFPNYTRLSSFELTHQSRLSTVGFLFLGGRTQLLSSLESRSSPHQLDPRLRFRVLYPPLRGGGTRVSSPSLASVGFVSNHGCRPLSLPLSYDILPSCEPDCEKHSPFLPWRVNRPALPAYHLPSSINEGNPHSQMRG